MKINNKFEQINRNEGGAEALQNIINKSPRAANILVILTSCSNKWGVAIISQEEIAHEMHVTRRTVNRLIVWLHRHQYIHIAHSGRANIYILNPDLLWRGLSNQKELARKKMKFPTMVTIDKETNNKLFNEYHKFLKTHKTKRTTLQDAIALSNSDIILKTNDNNMHSSIASYYIEEIKKDLIKMAILHTHYSPKEQVIISMIINKLPLQKKGMKTTNRKILKDCHNKGMKISYPTIANALNKLHNQSEIINRSKGYITFNKFTLNKVMKQIKERAIA